MKTNGEGSCCINNLFIYLTRFAKPDIHKNNKSLTDISLSFIQSQNTKVSMILSVAMATSVYTGNVVLHSTLNPLPDDKKETFSQTNNFRLFQNKSKAFADNNFKFLYRWRDVL